MPEDLPLGHVGFILIPLLVKACNSAWFFTLQTPQGFGHIGAQTSIRNTSASAQFNETFDLASSSFFSAAASRFSCNLRRMSLVRVSCGNPEKSSSEAPLKSHGQTRLSQQHTRCHIRLSPGLFIKQDQKYLPAGINRRWVLRRIDSHTGGSVNSMKFGNRAGRSPAVRMPRTIFRVPAHESRLTAFMSP
jgi:hypothetical protein